MQTTVNQNALATALALAASAIKSGASVPILSNVLLSANNGRITLSGTDLDLTLTTSVDANVAQDGAITLPAKRLLNIVRELQGDVSFEMNGKPTVTIRSGSAAFTIHGLAAGEFVSNHDLSEPIEFTIPANVLRRALEHTVPVSSTDQTRYVLNGALLEIRQANLFVVATDGRRLASELVAYTTPPAADRDAIVPAKACAELIKMLSGDAPVTVSVDKGKASFKTANGLLTTKLIEGSYPNFRQVTPTEDKIVVDFPRVALAEAISRVALMTSAQHVAVKITVEGGKAVIGGNTPEVGEASETLDVAYDGAPFTISLNPEFILFGLRNGRNERIKLHLNDSVSPVVLREEFTYVVMPLRTA